MKKSTRLKVCLNHQYLQGSWNFERMQNGGWCYGLLPALKELYPNKEDYNLAVERHLNSIIHIHMFLHPLLVSFWLWKKKRQKVLIFQIHLFKM